MVREKSCGAVLYRKTADGIKYLLLHYEAGHWDFPKGHQEKGEDEKQAAVREIAEETGIEDAEFADNFRETVNYFFIREGDTVHKEVAFFAASTIANKVSISKEHIGYAWAGYENALKRLTYETSKDLLRKAKEYIEKD